MNVLSLFDGISCGKVALDRAGIQVSSYYAAEIDKNAIKVSIANHPTIIQLGSVTDVKVENLPRIDLLIGGSPCQGFSFAGKQLNFNDPRSALFFEYVRILKDIRATNPSVKFLLENVKMKKEYQDVISEYLGVQPIEINSSIFSAQNRKRLYWTNIEIEELPADKGILLADIIESGYVDRQKDFCLDANYAKGGNLEQYFTKSRRQLVFGAAKRNQVTKTGVKPFLNVRKDNKSNCIVSSYSEKLNGVAFDGVTFRSLTPIECERLQTLSDNYTACISNSQRYKALGNGWTVDVIAHIFKGLK